MRCLATATSILDLLVSSPKCNAHKFSKSAPTRTAIGAAGGRKRRREKFFPSSTPATAFLQSCSIDKYRSLARQPLIPSPFRVSAGQHGCAFTHMRRPVSALKKKKTTKKTNQQNIKIKHMKGKIEVCEPSRTEKKKKQGTIRHILLKVRGQRHVNLPLVSSGHSSRWFCCTHTALNIPERERTSGVLLSSGILYGPFPTSFECSRLWNEKQAERPLGPNGFVGDSPNEATRFHILCETRTAPRSRLACSLVRPCPSEAQGCSLH